MSDALAAYLEGAIREGRTPGAVWCVADRRQTYARGALGAAALEPHREEASVDTLYDLASLTKPLATAILLVLLEQQGTLRLEAPLTTWLPELAGSPFGDATLLDAALHRAGFPAWRPLYLEGPGATAALAAIARTEAEPRGAVVYSDLGYLCLGWVLERAAEEGLDERFASRIAAPLGRSGIGFVTRVDCATAAPTERGNAFERAAAGAAGEGYAWREAVIRGRPHDGNAHALGGVAGHAGLFGHVDAVVDLALECVEPRALDLGDGARERLLRPYPGAEGRTVGFVEAAASQAARGVLPDDAPGHVGFPGTSVWLEPRRGRAYVLLTNRVHPRVEPRDFQPVRLGFHREAIALR